MVGKDLPKVCSNVVSEEARVKDELLEEVVGWKQNTGYHCCTLRCWANALRQGEGEGGGRGEEGEERRERRREEEEGAEEGRGGHLFYHCIHTLTLATRVNTLSRVTNNPPHSLHPHTLPHLLCIVP